MRTKKESLHKLSPLPRKSVPEGLNSFCKKAVFTVRNILLSARRAVQRIVPVFKRAVQGIPVLAKRVAQWIVPVFKRAVQDIPVLAKRVAQWIVPVSKRIAQDIPVLSKRVTQGFLLLVKKAWPVVKIILPPLVTGMVVFAALNSSGLIRAMIDDLVPVTGIVPAALLLLLISLIPVISPLVGPGIIIAVLAVILTGEQIAAGVVTPLMALPAFCAIDVLIGGKIIPRAFAMGETEPETINAGVPMVFFTRLITIPAAVAVAYLFSFILFQS